MNGLATRKKLHESIHGDIPHLPPMPLDERRGTSIIAGEFARYAAGYQPNADDLGTPLQAERIAAIRREKLYARVFTLGIWVVLGAGFFMLGLNSQIARDNVAIPPSAYAVRAAKLATGQRVCELDPHEGCLVCMHKDLLGQPSTETRC